MRDYDTPEEISTLGRLVAEHSKIRRLRERFETIVLAGPFDADRSQTLNRITEDEREMVREICTLTRIESAAA